MDRRELESAAVNYTHLRGLLAVPLGGLLVLAALGNWEWGPFRSTWVFLVCGALLVALCQPIVRHYDEHYGRITASTGRQVRGALATAAMVAVVLAASFVMRSSANWSLDLPVNGLAAALAAGFLTYHAVTVGVRRHHIAVWGALLAAAVLPAWGGLSLSSTSNVGLVLAGFAAMASGVLDHRLLARTLGRSHGVDLETRDVGA